MCAPLTATLARTHAQSHVLFVTFTNRAAGEFAVNWARQLQTIGLYGLVGVVDSLPTERTSAIQAAGSSLFCTTGELVRRNGQAGRWAEVAPLLRFGMHVVISDADVSWLRDPRAYFHEVRRQHPMLDFLLCTDRAFNGYNGEPLLRRPRSQWSTASQDLEGDLDLEDGTMSAVPSYNIGILVLYAHAAANLSAMIDVLWVDAVSRSSFDNRGRKEPTSGGLAAWDQGPINKFVLHGRSHPHDRALVLIDRALPSPSEHHAATDRHSHGPRVRLAMGVLPMLQFATAFTYFIKADRRMSLGARPYSLHAIYSHGHDHLRKRSLLREAHGWVDPPEYYSSRQRYLVYESSEPERFQHTGGFERILWQLKRFELAVRVASLANRTLVLPRLRCGATGMAYPCYAWYHRATTSAGFRHDTVPMPDHCPTYYWLNHDLASMLGIALREPTFLSNPRIPLAVRASRAILHICADGHGGMSGNSCSTGRAGSGGRASVGAGGAATGYVGRGRHTLDSRALAQPARDADRRDPSIPQVFSPSRTTPSRLAALMAQVSSASVLAITDLAPLVLDGAERIGPLSTDSRKVAPKPWLNGGLEEVTQLATGFWCTACVITRRGGVIQEINRSTVRELEKYCRVEARGHLGFPGARQTCCQKLKSADGCPICREGERQTRNESTLSVAMQQYLPVWARMAEPRSERHGGSMEDERKWRCLHPLCTGHEPDRYP